MRIFTFGILSLLCVAGSAHAGLEVEDLGKQYEPDPARIVTGQAMGNSGGDTSVRNTIRADLRWKEQGYFERNRDLGQVFTADRDFTIEAIVLRTGPGTSAVRPGAPGTKVFIQFFEVRGTPRINDNGTPAGTRARHGFSDNHRCDDFIEGVSYRSITVVHGGVFPQLPPTQDRDGKPIEGSTGTLRFMRWRLSRADRLSVRAGRQYAFMVGFDEPGEDRSFTLHNRNNAGSRAAPTLADDYPGGWGIRREGNGKVPPTLISAAQPPADVPARDGLIRESLFPAGDAHFALMPTSDGYPDVDTYRDLEFHIEGTSATDPARGGAPLRHGNPFAANSWASHVRQMGIRAAGERGVMRFLCIHSFPPGAITREQIEQFAQLTQRSDRVKGIQSFSSLSEGKAACIIEASNREIVQDFFRQNGMPYDSVTAIEVEGQGGLMRPAGEVESAPPQWSGI